MQGFVTEDRAGYEMPIVVLTTLCMIEPSIRTMVYSFRKEHLSDR